MFAVKTRCVESKINRHFSGAQAFCHCALRKLAPISVMLPIIKRVGIRDSPIARL